MSGTGSPATHLLEGILRLLEKRQKGLPGCACGQPLGDQGAHPAVAQVHHLLQHEGQVDAGHRKGILPVRALPLRLVQQLLEQLWLLLHSQLSIHPQRGAADELLCI